jgi:acetyl esterase
MPSSTSEEYRGTLPILRREKRRAIDKQVQVGKEVPLSGRGGNELVARFHGAEIPGSPTIFEVHGGGFALGDVRSNDPFREWICKGWHVNVIGVDYRLAPEHPFPCALHDVEDTLVFFSAHAGEFGLDTNSFYMMGYSAGANLAVSSCLDDAMLWKGSATPFDVKGLVLHYPFFDAATDPEEIGLRDIDLPADLSRAFNEWYVGNADPKNPLISPIFAPDSLFRGFPQTLSYPVVGDSGLDECVRLHEKLRRAGVDEKVVPVKHAYHGYVEDAANVEVYEATSFPESRDARPHDYVQTAERVVGEALDAFFPNRR